MWHGEVYACDYVIDGQQLGFVGEEGIIKNGAVSQNAMLSTASDSDQNLVLYQYQPDCK